MTSWSRRLLVAIALIAALALAACGGSQTKAPSGGGGAAPADQQVLRLRLSGEPKTLDPGLVNFTAESSLTRQLFAGLFTYGTDLKIVPSLATQVPSLDNGGISKDGMTFTVKLRDSKWSDGQPVTANDFVYSLQRVLDPKTASPLANLFFNITGAKDYNSALGTKDAPKAPSEAEMAALRSQVGVTARDDKTLVYQLKQPDPSFLNRLTGATAFPVREDVVKKYGDKWTEPGNLVGNGPFVLAEWAHNQSIVFTPNANWVGDKPKLSRMVVNFIADDSAAYGAYLAGDLDMVNVPAAVIKDVSSPASPQNAELNRIADLATFGLFMNEAVAPFDKEKVRQAFAAAIDRDAFVQGVLQGAGQPTTSWVPRGMPGYNAEIGKQFTFSASKAKQLMSEAGYPDGKGFPTVSLLLVSSESNKVIGQFLQDQFKKNLGVEVTLDLVDSKTYGGTFTTNKYSLTVAGWVAGWAYPDNFLAELFLSDAINNHVGFKNAKFDDLIAKAAADQDEKKRLGYYDEAQKLLIDTAAIAPIYNRQAFVLVKPRVKDLVMSPVDGGLRGDYNFAHTYIAAAD